MQVSLDSEGFASSARTWNGTRMFIAARGAKPQDELVFQHNMDAATMLSGLRSFCWGEARIRTKDSAA